MQLYALPLAFVVLLWWASTGLLLWVIRRPAAGRRLRFAVATVLATLAALGLWASSGRSTAAAGYCAFSCTLVLWAWQELGFLAGFLTGSRRAPATPGLEGWPRAREAFQAIAHHEAALLALAAVVLAATWGQPNQTGAWTFAVLWTMRQSAKLNLFLGVRNLYERFLPLDLRYLHTYFRRAPMNGLFPWSVLGATAVVVPLWLAASRAADAATAVGCSLVAALLALAILEHWLLVLPLQGERLWHWALGQRGGR